MTREEFIDWLKSQENRHRESWVQVATNTDEFWHLHIPMLDFFAPQMRILEEEGYVKYEYGEMNDYQMKKMTYMDFVDMVTKEKKYI